MFWLPLTIAAYALNAVGILTDKLLLRRTVPHAAVYTFYVSSFGALAILLLPFAPGIPPAHILIVALIAGATFTLALFLFYSLLRMTDASEASPIVGSLTPVAVLALAAVFLNESLTVQQIVAFGVILLGSVILAHDEHRPAHEPELHLILIGASAAFLYGLSHVLSKFVYVEHDFLNGMVWRTLGSSLAAMLLLVSRTTRKHIVDDIRRPKPETGALFLAGKVCGAASFVLVSYSYTIGSIAIVNALSGVQYFFLFIFLMFLARSRPHLLAEHLTGRSLIRKLVSLALIIAGIALLFT
jgi:drug/metabolite transporter (DMT)-like permease